MGSPHSGQALVMRCNFASSDALQLCHARPRSCASLHLYPPVSEKKQNVKSTIIITEGKLSGAVFMPIGALGRMLMSQQRFVDALGVGGGGGGGGGGRFIQS